MMAGLGTNLHPAVRHGRELPGYLVGEDGGVFTLWRSVGTGRIRWEMGDNPERLKPYPVGKNGAYLGVALRVNGRTLRMSVHSLVMESFRGPCPAGHEVCHGDGNGHNNQLHNLRYGTKASNQADKRLHGTHQDGEHNHAAQPTGAHGGKLRPLREWGTKLKELAIRFGVRESTVSRIASGVRRSRC